MQIVALGGGGFSAEPENPLMDDYLLSLSRNSRPRVCFVPTASGDSDDYCLRFFHVYSKRDCRPAYLPLFKRTIDDLRSFLLEQDVIYVGGGNTANMLAVWRVHGVDKILRECYAAGTIMCGVSAGSLCWFEAGVTDSFSPNLGPLNDGLGLLAGSNCPHYDGEAKRRPTYQRLISEGFPAGYAADDGCALHFENAKLKRIVSSRPNARAYRVEMMEGQCVETVLDADYLGGRATS